MALEFPAAHRVSGSRHRCLSFLIFGPSIPCRDSASAGRVRRAGTLRVPGLLFLFASLPDVLREAVREIRQRRKLSLLERPADLGAALAQVKRPLRRPGGRTPPTGDHRQTPGRYVGVPCEGEKRAASALE